MEAGNFLPVIGADDLTILLMDLVSVAEERMASALA